MTTTKSIAEGDRIYATETIVFGDPEDPTRVIEKSDEGMVIELIRDGVCDLLVEWDAGFAGAVDSGDVALADSPLGSPDNPCDCGNGELLMPCEHWQAIGRTA